MKVSTVHERNPEVTVQKTLEDVSHELQFIKRTSSLTEGEKIMETAGEH